MQYVNISDLKKQAKKERKNNPSIKNHAESLKHIANKYNFNSWSELLDSSKITANNEKVLFQDDHGNIYTYSENNRIYFHDENSRISLINKRTNILQKNSNEKIIINAIEQLNAEISSFYNLLKHDEYEELYSFVSKNLLVYPFQENNSIWPDRARILCRVVSYVFRNSDCEKTFANFRRLVNLENLLCAILKNDLESNHRVIDFLEIIQYNQKLEKNKPIKIEHENLEQNAFLAMQMTCGLGVWDSAFLSFEPENANINTIRYIMNNNRDALFTLGMAKKHINPRNLAFYEYLLMLEKDKNSITNEDTLKNVLNYFEKQLTDNKNASIIK